MSQMTADQVAENCPATIYGVPVSFLGEEQDGIAAFTSSPRRALAAMRALVRREVGDPLPELYDVTSLRSRWVVAYDDCGCVHADPAQCSAETNGDMTCCPVIPATDDYPAEVEEHDCQRYGLLPCVEDLYSWVMTTVPEGTPGAMLVFEVHQ